MTDDTITVNTDNAPKYLGAIPHLGDHMLSYQIKEEARRQAEFQRFQAEEMGKRKLSEKALISNLDTMML